MAPRTAIVALCLVAFTGPGRASADSLSEDAGPADPVTPVPPTSLRFIGRFDHSDPAGPRFAWSASAISIRFAGTSVAVRLRDEGANELQVIVDGVPTAVLATAPTRELYPVAEHLRPGVHEVTLSKRTEASVGEMLFLGFVLGPGASPRPMPAPRTTRKIEFLGDSITAGFGNEGKSPTCSFSPATEDEFMSYGAIAARDLRAEHVTIAWSGKTIDAMGKLYSRTLPGRADSQWDFASWTPDVVVVNLGTNDFFQGDLREAAFATAYVPLLRQIRSRYPAALIVCALGPMLSDTYPVGAMTLTRARRFLDASVQAVRAEGDKRIAILEFPPQDPTAAGCAFHPNLRTHRHMAAVLEAEIRHWLRW